MSPFGVEMMAMPRSDKTRGSSVDFAYTRAPGLLIRFTSRKRGWVSSYCKPSRNMERLATTSFSTPATYPSFSRILAIENFMAEYGKTTSRLPTTMAFRNRVSMSEIGSVNIKLPARFNHTRDFPTVGQFAETDTTQLKITNKAMSTTTTPTPVHDTCRELGFAIGFSDLVW